jgi:hypothetical protein
MRYIRYMYIGSFWATTLAHFLRLKIVCTVKWPDKTHTPRYSKHVWYVWHFVSALGLRRADRRLCLKHFGTYHHLRIAFFILHALPLQFSLFFVVTSKFLWGSIATAAPGAPKVCAPPEYWDNGRAAPGKAQSCSSLCQGGRDEFPIMPWYLKILHSLAISGYIYSAIYDNL